MPQLSLRESTPKVRQRGPGAVRASWAVVVRSLVLSVGFGLFLAFVGVHTAVGGPIWVRAIYFSALILTASAMVQAVVVILPSWAKGSFWKRVVLVAAVTVVPMGVIVWCGDRLFGQIPPTLSELPSYIATSLAVSSFFSLFVSLNMARANSRDEAPAAEIEPGRPRFLDRVPPKLTGAAIWAVEAEDHYLRLHTSKGQDLILMRLTDAIAELEGLEGAQTHRSWWVARSAISQAKRGDGRATLRLPDGAEAPVSRSYAKALRDKGWI